MTDHLLSRDGRLTRLAINEMPQIMNLLQLHSPRNNNNNNEFTENSAELVLTPSNVLNTSFENSFMQHLEAAPPSQDEIVIRQRGRKKHPIINWSPTKRAFSPLKTPTKKSHHLSLLMSNTPSPSKRNSPKVLRSSPRKRLLLIDTPNSSTFSSPTHTKRLRFEETSLNSTNYDIPLNILLKGLSNEQLIQVICDVARKDESLEHNIRANLPVADLIPLEQELIQLRKNILKSSPRSRLVSKTDGVAYGRAVEHLITFKKKVFEHCKTLVDSSSWDAIIDYVKIAWGQVRSLPIWDLQAHNNCRRECFKILTVNAKLAIRNGGCKLGIERIKDFKTQILLMSGDFEEIATCKDSLVNLIKVK